MGALVPTYQSETPVNGRRRLYSFFPFIRALTVQDMRKHPRLKQLQGAVWVLYGEISTNLLPDDKNWDDMTGRRCRRQMSFRKLTSSCMLRYVDSLIFCLKNDQQRHLLVILYNLNRYLTILINTSGIWANSEIRCENGAEKNQDLNLEFPSTQSCYNKDGAEEIAPCCLCVSFWLRGTL